MSLRVMPLLHVSRRSVSGLRCPGYTLFEFVAVILIVGIIAAIGAPTFQYVTGSNRVVTEANQLLGDMQFARSEAVREGQTVTICAANVSATGSYPNKGCSGGSSWNSGWIVFSDLNADQALDANDIVLRVQPAFNSTDSFVSADNFSAATFNREGFARGYAGTTVLTLPVTIALRSTPINTDWTHCLVISFSAMPTTEVYGVGTPKCS